MSAAGATDCDGGAAAGDCNGSAGGEECEGGGPAVRAGHVGGRSASRTPGGRARSGNRRRLSAVFLGCVASHTGKDPAYRRKSLGSTSSAGDSHVLGPLSTRQMSPPDGSATIKVTRDKWRRLSKSLLVLTLRKRTRCEDEGVGGGWRVGTDERVLCSSPETRPCPPAPSPTCTPPTPAPAPPTTVTVPTPGHTQDTAGSATCSPSASCGAGDYGVVAAERVKLRHTCRTPPHTRPTSCPDLHLNLAKRPARLTHSAAACSGTPVAESDGKCVSLRERPLSWTGARRGSGVQGRGRHYWHTLQPHPNQNLVNCFLQYFHRLQPVPLDFISDDTDNATSYCITTYGI